MGSDSSQRRTVTPLKFTTPSVPVTDSEAEAAPAAAAGLGHDGAAAWTDSESMRCESHFYPSFGNVKAFNLKKLKSTLSPSPQWPQAALRLGGDGGQVP